MLARKIWAFWVSDFGEFVDMNQIIINQMKYAIMITILNFSSTGDSRWLELRSLEVLDLSKSVHGPDFFLYITKQIYS